MIGGKVNSQWKWVPMLIDALLFLIMIFILLLTVWVTVLGPMFTWQEHFYTSVIDPMGWVTLPLIFGVSLLVLLRDKLAEFTVSASGIKAKMRDVVKQQTEVKKLGQVLMEGLVRVSQNSQRWSGWTPREISKLERVVESLADTLDLSHAERETVWASRVRWSLIDKSGELFDRTVKLGQTTAKDQDRIRKEYDEEWQQNDVVSPTILEGLLGLLFPDWRKNPDLRNKFEEYESEYSRSIFSI